MNKILFEPTLFLEIKGNNLRHIYEEYNYYVLLDFSLTVKAATSIFISGCGTAISSAEGGK